MCLPHDPVSLLRWLESSICVLRAWRDELACDPPQARRADDVGRGLVALEREAMRLRADLGLAARDPVCEPPPDETRSRRTRH